MRVGPETRKLNQRVKKYLILSSPPFFLISGRTWFPLKILLSNQFPRFNIIIWVPSQNHTFLLKTGKCEKDIEMRKRYLCSEFGRCKEVLILCIFQVQIPGRAEQSDRAACQPGGLLSEKLQNRFPPVILHSVESPAFTAQGWACGFHRLLLEEPHDSEVGQTPTFHEGNGRI